jgi:hypothetical protein
VAGRSVSTSKRYKTKEREQLIETVRTSDEPVKVVAGRMGAKESTAYEHVKAETIGDFSHGRPKARH